MAGFSVCMSAPLAATDPDNPEYRKRVEDILKESGITVVKEYTDNEPNRTPAQKAEYLLGMLKGTVPLEPHHLYLWEAIINDRLVSEFANWRASDANGGTPATGIQIEAAEDELIEAAALHLRIAYLNYHKERMNLNMQAPKFWQSTRYISNALQKSWNKLSSEEIWTVLKDENLAVDAKTLPLDCVFYRPLSPSYQLYNVHTRAIPLKDNLTLTLIESSVLFTANPVSFYSPTTLIVLGLLADAPLSIGTSPAKPGNFLYASQFNQILADNGIMVSLEYREEDPSLPPTRQAEELLALVKGERKAATCYIWAIALNDELIEKFAQWRTADSTGGHSPTADQLEAARQELIEAAAPQLVSSYFAHHTARTNLSGMSLNKIILTPFWKTPCYIIKALVLRWSTLTPEQISLIRQDNEINQAPELRPLLQVDGEAKP